MVILTRTTALIRQIYHSFERQSRKLRGCQADQTILKKSRAGSFPIKARSRLWRECVALPVRVFLSLLTSFLLWHGFRNSLSTEFDRLPQVNLKKGFFRQRVLSLFAFDIAHTARQLPSRLVGKALTTLFHFWRGFFLLFPRSGDTRRCAPPNRYFSAGENIPQLPVFPHKEKRHKTSFFPSFDEFQSRGRYEIKILPRFIVCARLPRSRSNCV